MTTDTARIEVKRQASELAALRRTLSASQGVFSLSVAVCSNRVLRDRLIETLRSETAGIRIVQISNSATDILAVVEKDFSVSGGDASAIFLTNLDGALPSDREDHPILRVLNASRERWKKAVSCPVVFWMPEYAARLLSIHARDFWAWKSHQFDFVAEPSMEAAMPSVHFDVGLAASFSADEKRFRLAELEQRIADAGCPPPSELAPHIGQWLNEMGVIRSVLGDSARAIRAFQQSLELAREIGDRRGEGVALGNLGNAYLQLGDARKAIEYHEKALVIRREIGDRRGEGAALGNLGNAYAQLGDARKAIEFYEKRLVIARGIRDRRGEGVALGNLGIAYAQLGDARKAVEFFQRHLAIVIDPEIRDRQGEGNALGNLGNAYLQLGDARKAIEYHEKALVIRREIGDRRGEGVDLFNMALALDSLGKRAESIRDAEAALAIYEQIEDPNADTARKQIEEWRKQKEE